MVNCPLCAGPIMGGSVIIENVQYHPNCFTCKKCAKKCRLKYFQTINNKFYCQDCVDKTPELYHTVRNIQKSAEALRSSPPKPPPRRHISPTTSSSSSPASSPPPSSSRAPPLPVKRKEKCSVM